MKNVLLKLFCIAFLSSFTFTQEPGDDYYDQKYQGRNNDRLQRAVAVDNNNFAGDYRSLLGDDDHYTFWVNSGESFTFVVKFALMNCGN